MSHQALTLDRLIERLIEVRGAWPGCARRPVQMLVLDGDGWVTGVEVDCFDEAQGVVVTLLADAEPAL